MKKIILSLALIQSCLSLSAAESHYPVKIESCGHTLVFNKAPERVIGVGQGTVEILYSLGLADRVIGTSLWVEPVLAEFKEANENIEVLADNDVSFERIIQKKPDFITSQFQWQIGPVGVIGTNEQFAEFDIPVYTSPADCVSKDNSGKGRGGVRSSVFSMDLIYQEIAEISEIFDIQERGDQLIADLKNREAIAKDKVKNLPNDMSAVFWFSSADADSDPYIAGTKGAAGYIMTALGMKNVTDVEAEWPAVSWESIIRANPTIIVVGDMTRRRFAFDDIKIKIDYLNTDPVLKETEAVKNQRIVTIGAQSMNPTLRTMDGLEKVADELSKMNLQ